MTDPSFEAFLDIVRRRLERLRDELQRVDPGPDRGTAAPTALVGPDREHAIAVLGGRCE